MEAVHDWLHDQVKRVSGASDLAKAMRYAIRHWALAMTLIQTAKLNVVDPMAWLTDMHEMSTLLPWNWAAGNASPQAEPLAA